MSRSGSAVVSRLTGTIHVNISKYEQRVLHALAQGGAIHHRRDTQGRIVEAICFTREGHVLADGSLPVFRSSSGAGLSSARVGSRTGSAGWGWRW